MVINTIMSYKSCELIFIDIMEYYLLLEALPVVFKIPVLIGVGSVNALFIKICILVKIVACIISMTIYKILFH